MAIVAFETSMTPYGAFQIAVCPICVWAVFLCDSAFFASNGSSFDILFVTTVDIALDIIVKVWQEHAKP